MPSPKILFITAILLVAAVACADATVTITGTAYETPGTPCREESTHPITITAVTTRGTPANARGTLTIGNDGAFTILVNGIDTAVTVHLTADTITVNGIRCNDLTYTHTRTEDTPITRTITLGQITLGATPAGPASPAPTESNPPAAGVTDATEGDEPGVETSAEPVATEETAADSTYASAIARITEITTEVEDGRSRTGVDKIKWKLSAGAQTAVVIGLGKLGLIDATAYNLLHLFRTNAGAGVVVQNGATRTNNLEMSYANDYEESYNRPDFSRTTYPPFTPSNTTVRGANQGGLANYITPALTRETNFEVNVADAHPTFKSRLNSLNGVYYVTGYTQSTGTADGIVAYERTPRRTEDTWFVVGQGSGVLQTLVYPSYDRKVPSTIKFKGAEFELKSVSRNGWFAMEIRAPNTETINWRENDRKFISNPIGESYFVYRAHLNSENPGDVKDFALTLSRTPPREDEDGNAAANLENYPALRDWDDYFVLTIIDLTEPAAEEAEETPATEEPVAATPGEEETPAEEPAETPADTTISCTVTNRLEEVGNGIVWIINNLPDAVRSVTFNVVNPRTNPASATRSPFTLNRPTAADSWLITAGRGILNIPSRGATLSVEDRGTNPRNPHYQVRTATERSYSVRLAMVGGEPQEVPCNPPQASEEAQANGARRCSITVGPNFCWYNGKPRQYIGVSLTPPPNSYDGMRVIADAERGVAAQPIRFTQTTTSVNPDRRFLTCNNPTWLNNNMLLTLRVSTGELYQCRVPTIGWPTQSQSCTIRLTPNGDRCTVRLSARIEIRYTGSFYDGEPRVLATDILHGPMLEGIGFNLVSQLDGTGFTIGDTVSISNAICARIRTTYRSNIVDITRTPAGGTAINYRCTIEGAAAPTSP